MRLETNIETARAVLSDAIWRASVSGCDPGLHYCRDANWRVWLDRLERRQLVQMAGQQSGTAGPDRACCGTMLDAGRTLDRLARSALASLAQAQQLRWRRPRRVYINIIICL